MNVEKQIYDAPKKIKQKIYRYRVKNWNSLDNKLFKENYLTIFLLEKETEIDAILAQDALSNSIQFEKRVFIRTLALTHNKTLPIDYNSNLYLYSIEPVNLGGKDIELFFDDYQATKLEIQQQNEDNENIPNVINTSILKNLQQLSTNKNLGYYSIYVGNEKDENGNNISDEIISHFLVNNLEIEHKGLQSSVSALMQYTENVEEVSYILNQDNKYYAVIDGKPILNNGKLNLESRSLNVNRLIPLEKARQFLVEGGIDHTNIFSTANPLDFMDGNTVAGSLNWLLLSALYISRKNLDNFKGLIIDDKDSINYGKINMALIPDLYGIDKTEIKTIPVNEIVARMLKSWETQYSGTWEEPEYPNWANYQSLKTALAALGEYIPNQYAYGNYDEINRLTNNYYFEITEQFVYDSSTKLIERNPFKIQLRSLRYELNEFGSLRNEVINFDNITTPITPAKNTELTAPIDEIIKNDILFVAFAASNVATIYSFKEIIILNGVKIWRYVSANFADTYIDIAKYISETDTGGWMEISIGNQYQNINTKTHDISTAIPGLEIYVRSAGIKGLKKLFASSEKVRNGKVGGQIIIPNPETNLTTQASEVSAASEDTTKNDFLKYPWLVQLNNASAYERLFSADKVVRAGVQETKTNGFTRRNKLPQIPNIGDTYYEPNALPYIIETLPSGMFVLNDSAIIEYVREEQVSEVVVNPPTNNYPNNTVNWYKEYVYKLTYVIQAANEVEFKSNAPYIINSSTMIDFRNNFLSNDQSFEYEIDTNYQIDNSALLKEILINLVLAPKITLKLEYIKNNGSIETLILPIKTQFVDDNSISRIGVRV